jgi:hypothetical protein
MAVLFFKLKLYCSLLYPSPKTIISSPFKFSIDSKNCHLLLMLAKNYEAYYYFYYIANRWGPQGLNAKY